MNKKIVVVKKESSVESVNDSSSKDIEKDTGKNYKTFNSEEMNSMEQENFEELFEQSMSSFNKGEVVEGIIVGTKDDSVFIDVGYKLEGQIRRNEFIEEPIIGSKIKAMVMVMGDGDDSLILSKRQADFLVGKEVITKAYEEESPIQGTIIREIKGGYRVLVSGMECFLPFSQLDIRRVIDPASFLDKEYTFKVSAYTLANNNVVLSRKAYLEEQRSISQVKLFERLKEGDVLSGVVKKIESYGIFVNIDNIIDGFVHVKDLSWVHVKDCHEVVSEADVLDFKVLKVNSETRKINLGLRQMQEDPWIQYAKEHKVGDVVKGEVIRMVNFGAFIKLEDGVDALLHVKELSWTKRVNHPQEVLKIGDLIESKILSIDKDNRRLSLSLRDVLPNPWEEVEANYPRGTIAEGIIKSITAFGIFIELEEGMLGLLHKDNIDWTKKHSNPKQHNFKAGDTIKVIVLSSSSVDNSISLGLKQLEENPWLLFKSKHPEGSLIKGEVVRLGDNGVYVKVADDFEAFLHASNTIKKKDQKIEDIYTPGLEVEAVIKHIDIIRNRINISVRDYAKKKEDEVIKKYVVRDVSSSGTGATLGDFIKFNNIEDN